MLSRSYWPPDPYTLYKASMFDFTRLYPSDQTDARCDMKYQHQKNASVRRKHSHVVSYVKVCKYYTVSCRQDIPWGV